MGIVSKGIAAVAATAALAFGVVAVPAVASVLGHTATRGKKPAVALVVRRAGPTLGPPPFHCPPNAMCAKPGARTVNAGEAQNGSSVTLRAGDHLVVTLHSTYWRFDAPSDPSVLSADGQARYSPGGPGCPSFPGSGCGTVTERYTARRSGSAGVSAGRTSCGEAMACQPGRASHYTLSVGVG